MALDKSVVISLLLVCVVAVCYHNSVQCGFAFDDLSAIVENADLRPTTPVANLFWNDFWGTPMRKETSHKSYRPLCVLTFRFNYMLHKLQPAGYHAFNALLHALVCLMFFRVCQILLSHFASAIASLLFAVHPVHTEAVTGVVGRAELLSSVFYLAAIVTYAKCSRKKLSTKWFYLVLTVVLVAMAMLCKEQGITVVGVCCVYEVFVVQKLTLADLLGAVRSLFTCQQVQPVWLKSVVMRAVCLVTVTLLLLMARIRVMGAKLPVFTSFDNPAATATSPSRQLTYNYLLPVNLWLLLCPTHLCCDWTMGTIPLVHSIMDARNLATFAFYMAFGCLVKFALCGQGKQQRVVIMSLAMTVFPFVPALNLFFPVGFVVAERVLYLPSMGFCMLVGLGAGVLYKKCRFPFVFWCGMTILLLAHSVKTVWRNYDWESEYTLFQSALRVNRRNAKLFNNVGHALENNHDHQGALQYFQHAVSIQPDDIGAHMNVGRAMKNLNRTDEAEQAFHRALALFPPMKKGKTYKTRIAPNYLNVFISLASIIANNQSRLEEANSLLGRAIGMRPDFTKAYINRGDILMKLGRQTEAREHYETALSYEQDNPDIYYNLGVVFLEQKMANEAMKYFDQALALNPDHAMTLFNSAILLQDLGSPGHLDKAYQRLMHVRQLEPQNEKVPFNLGMVTMDKKQFDEALVWFDKAIEMKEDFASALFNAALMLVNDIKRPLDALPYLRKLLKSHPTHTKGLLLLGDIQLNSQSDAITAESTFRAALSTAPRGSAHHAHAYHSLCVALVTRGELVAAETCLVEAARLDPSASHIQEHLAIVRTRIRDAQRKT